MSDARSLVEPLRLPIGSRCPGCHVVCASLDAEHLDDCAYVGKITVLFCTLGCMGPWHDRGCDLFGHTRYTR